MRIPLVVVALALAAACAKNPKPVVARSSANVLTQQEIATATVDNAYDAVQRLRPAFLRAKSTGSTRNAFAELYVDGIRRGSLELLRGMTPASIVEVRYMSAVEATTRYGLNVSGGVLEVTTIRKP